MKTWADRLSEWIEKKGWNVAEYARRVNSHPNLPVVSVWLIRKYIKGKVANPRGDMLDRLARPFGKTAIELQYGVQLDNLAKAVTIPLLNMNEVGTLNHDGDIGRAAGGRSVSVYSDDVVSNWFGVIVADDACAPKFSKGDTVWCDPSADIEPGSLVVASIKGLSLGVCRRFRQINATDPQAFKLVALNPDFPDIENSADNPVLIHGRIVRIVTAAGL